MLTILFHITVKAGQEQAFHDMAIRLTEVTRAEDEGCLAYIFHQQQGEPGKYVLYEQWQDGDALGAHLAHLRELLGPAAEGEALPASLLDMCESTNSVFYDVVA
jgi:quinol monooxygenase YgiN